MRNVIASLWRPKEGMEIHDLGGFRYSFVFYHKLDLQKVVDGGPWSFEHAMLVYHHMKDNEDPHLVELKEAEIWVQGYDIPRGLLSENILKSIGGAVKKYVKSDPANFDGHSERDCGIVCANPDKLVDRVYGPALRALARNAGLNVGSRWLRNGTDDDTGWSSRNSQATPAGGVQGQTGRDNGDRSDVNQIQNVLEGNGNEESGANQVITLEPKRKRVEELWVDNSVSNSLIDLEANKESGSKNGLGAGEMYTWEKSRGSVRWVQERLDRGMENKAWQDLFPAAQVRVLEVSTSDHLPLFLNLNRQVFMPREKRFKFENIWIKDKECRNIVQDCWNAAGRELKNLRSRRDAGGIQKYNKVRWEFLCLLEKQEIFWKQRAKQFWLREGDKNSHFFHKLASTRRGQNSLKRIKDANGEWQETEAEIPGVVVDYFSELFQSSEVDEGLLQSERVSLVTEEQNSLLVRSVTSDEVEHAVFAMFPDKSPGVDGLNPSFFQTYWDIVKGDITKFCQVFFDTGVLPDHINHTIVCLIPKVKHPKQMSDLRPISLCNVLMRILSKAMTNRLKPCLQNIVSPNQSAFIEGRLLTDNVLIAYEINHYLHRRTQGKSGVVVLKLDISKAYDRLEWGFVEKMLRKFNFHLVWIDRIMRCMSTVCYSFFRDGKIFGNVRPQRGVRQGDPISPYLYILCAERLTTILRRYEDNGLIHRCKISRGVPSVSHMLFADDCYLFFRATQVEAGIIKDILNKYDVCQGRLLTMENRVLCLAVTLVCKTVVWCVIVCRLEKLVSRRNTWVCNKREVFGFLVNRVGHKLQGWTNKSLSKDGKLTLLKSAAQVVPNFWMSLFLLPSSVCDDIEKLMNGFWCIWLSWDNISVVKSNVGLGLKQLTTFNIAMLAKQGILEASEALKANCRRKIGNGASTRFWFDQWLPDIENGFLSTPMPGHLQNIMVRGLMDMEGRNWDRDVLNDICNNRDIELIIRIPIPSEDRDDSWFWLSDNKGKFSVCTCYRWLQGESVSDFASFWKKFWSLNMPVKVLNFLWRVCKGCLPTTVALVSKRGDISAIFPWCYGGVESDTHVFFECDFAKIV
ncbi:uncharacterized protein LOC141691812 [Apium graveolens]|uniref:uncharacterized protein LOC141691812 n=1 Tax=Apium graveolens TaxID=4045 RepID=UPI003D79EFC1